MATSGIWGIDVGTCGLKALRCELNDEGTALVATAFDYIEYPKILSQPDADPKLMISEAFAQFLSRNKLKGDRVAMSVSGQFGLTRFFKPPPIEQKRLPDLVRFEAKQSIPFPLEEVVWDWHQLAGGLEVEGLLLELEVGLFAMKREQVFKALEPFKQAGIELDAIQLAPLCIYNAVTHDVLGDAPGEYDPDSPPESLIVLSMGTDTTDLVITNGFRMWLRNVPVGGSHFTKQLTKEHKLTYTKAEHTKRNARQAEDPKALFQAMRPVFGDLVNEVQRSLMNFENTNRKAKLGKIVVLGNAAKLPGLAQYLGKNIGHECVEFSTFSRLDTTAIDSSPNFKENIFTFGVCYGLCLQGLGLAKVQTNLMPVEIVMQRVVREKKPWTLAAVSALLLAWSLNYFLTYKNWFTVHPDRQVGDTSWAQAGQLADSVKQVSSGHVTKDQTLVGQLSVLKALGVEVAGNNDRRLMWLELVSALSAALPRTPNTTPGVPPDPVKVPFVKRQEIHIEYVESEYFQDLKQWYSESLKNMYLQGKRSMDMLAATPVGAAVPGGAGVPAAGQPAAGQPVAGAPAAGAPAAGAPAAGAPAAGAPAAGAPAAGAPLAGQPVAGAAGAEPTDPGPEKEGWVIEMRGYHYFNGDPQTSGPSHVLRTLLWNLEYGQVPLPVDPGADGQGFRMFTMKEIGILYPTLIADSTPDWNYRIPNPLYEGFAGGSAGGAGGMMPGVGGAAPGVGGAAPGLVAPGGMGPGAGKGGPGPGGFGAGKGNDSGKDAKKDETAQPESFEAPRYTFTIQFVWKPTPLSERLQKIREKEEAEKAAAAAAAQNAGQPAAGQPVAGAPGNPAPGVPGNPAPGVPGNPAPGVPGNPAPGVPGNPAPGVPGNPAPGVPGNPAPGVPGNPAPGVPAPGNPAPGGGLPPGNPEAAG